MVVFPNSKINLGLNVLERRADGYHEIESVFYPIPYVDVLEFISSPQPEDTFEYSGKPIPGADGDNLIARAIIALRSKVDFPFLKVYLHKEIAMGAGLGGGSADASFLLQAINTHFSLGLGSDQLEEIALELGSDCPFFIGNSPTFAQGRGEIFTPCTLDLGGLWIVLVTSDAHISTANAYQNIQRVSNRQNPKEVVETYSIKDWKSKLSNDFEGYAFKQFPHLKEIKSGLYSMGAAYASMTGSGSAIFGLFSTKPDVAQLSSLKGAVWTAQL